LTVSFFLTGRGARWMVKIW